MKCGGVKKESGPRKRAKRTGTNIVEVELETVDTCNRIHIVPELSVVLLRSDNGY